VKLSASVPQEWKLNRKLFHCTAKPYLKRTKLFFHGNGTLPYYSWKTNIFIQFFTWSYRQLAKRIGLIKGNQGPWGDWKEMVRDQRWSDFVNNFNDIQNQIPFKEKNKNLIEIVGNKELNVSQYVNLTQIIYHLS